MNEGNNKRQENTSTIYNSFKKQKQSSSSSGDGIIDESKATENLSYIPDSPASLYPHIIKQYQDDKMADKLVLFYVLPGKVESVFVEVVNGGRSLKLQYTWPISIKHVSLIPQQSLQLINSLKFGLNEIIQSTTSTTNKFPQRTFYIHLPVAVIDTFFQDIVKYEGGLRCLLIDVRCIDQTFRVVQKVTACQGTDEIVIPEEDE
jgi:hypothetical protein